jgi:hypothetical protein
MRCLITTKSRSLYVIPLLIDFPTSCNAFFTTSCNTRRFSPRQIDRCSSSNAIKLLAGRERRTSSSSSSTPSSSSSSSTPSSSPSSFSDAHSVEQKLLQKEEEARQKRNGQAKRRLEKSVRREERISVLESKANSDDGTGNGNMITEAEMAELKGLLKVRSTFEEQYDPLTFTKEHLDFKSMHNNALIALSRYCERERKSCTSGGSGGSGGNGEETQPINVFFLDGPDGGTANAMLDQGNFDAKQLFVANRHESSCNLLKMSGGGRLPDENVVHATATEALTIGATPLSTPLDMSSNDDNDDNDDDNDDDKSIIREEGGAFSNIDFSAYYFDGCGGFVPHITSMMSAALLREGCDPQKPIAVGYSLLGGNKDVVEKELAVSQALTIIARRRGMRMVHVMDDPSRYGLPLDIKKIGGSGGGGTFTTWLLLESEK